MKYLKNNFKIQDSLVAFIADGMGEIDYLIPLLNELYEEKKLNISIIFLNPIIYKKFSNSDFYSKIVKNLNIEIIQKGNFIFSNLFFKNKFFQKYFVNFPNQLFYLLRITPNILQKLFSTENIFIELSGNPNGSKFLNLLLKFFYKKHTIFVHPHGCVPNLDKFEPILHKAKIFKNSNYIITRPEEKYYYKILGFKGDPYYIDFPASGKNWKKKIQLLFEEPYNQNYICIYLNRITVNDWGNEKIYEKLLSDVLEVLKNIKELSKFKIIIKKNQKYFKKDIEDKILNKLLKLYNITNFEFTDESIFILSTFSKFNICINSNAIFASHSVNKNSFFYFEENLEFKKFFPNGHKSKYCNLPNITEKSNLKEVIKRYIS